MYPSTDGLALSAVRRGRPPKESVTAGIATGSPSSGRQKARETGKTDMVRD